MALGFTQPLTEMSTRNIFWVKVGRCVGLTTLPPSCTDLKSGSLKLLEPSGPVQASNEIGLTRITLAWNRAYCYKCYILLYCYKCVTSVSNIHHVSFHMPLVWNHCTIPDFRLSSLCVWDFGSSGIYIYIYLYTGMLVM
jgi:hypothetical protein